MVKAVAVDAGKAARERLMFDAPFAVGDFAVPSIGGCLANKPYGA